MTLSPKCILDVATFELTNDIVLKSFYVKNKQKNILSYSFPNNFLSTLKILFLRINIAYLFPTES